MNNMTRNEKINTLATMIANCEQQLAGIRELLKRELTEEEAEKPLPMIKKLPVERVFRTKVYLMPVRLVEIDATHYWGRTAIARASLVGIQLHHGDIAAEIRFLKEDEKASWQDDGLSKEIVEALGLDPEENHFCGCYIPLNMIRAISDFDGYSTYSADHSVRFDFENADELQYHNKSTKEVLSQILDVTRREALRNAADADVKADDLYRAAHMIENIDQSDRVARHLYQAAAAKGSEAANSWLKLFPKHD